MTIHARWTLLEAVGKEVILEGTESRWRVFECESELQAQHIVRELKKWSKQTHDAEAVNRLMRAGD